MARRRAPKGSGDVASSTSVFALRSEEDTDGKSCERIVLAGEGEVVVRDCEWAVLVKEEVGTWAGRRVEVIEEPPRTVDDWGRF